MNFKMVKVEEQLKVKNSLKNVWNTSTIFHQQFSKFQNSSDRFAPRFFQYLLFIFPLFFIFSCSAKATPPPLSTDTSGYQLIQTVPIQARWMTADKLQQLYVVTAQNEVIKYSPKGVELFRFSNNMLGDLVHIDVTNPFSILLYYPDFLTVYTLDRTLNKTGEFNFLDLNLIDVEAVATSNDNNVWLYDVLAYRIKKINRKGEVLTESDNLNNQFPEALRPNFILERENWLYVNDPKLGVLVFDNYGQYAKTLDIKNLENFQVMDNRLIFREKQQLKSFHLKALNTQIIDLPKGISEEEQLVIQKSRLFVLKKDSVDIYEY